MNYKSLIATTAIILILTLSFIVPYTKTSSIVYADTTTQWETVTNNDDLAWAFKVYCKSRNLAIEGSILDAVTAFTTYTFNNICYTIGIDATALQAHIKKSTDSNGNLQFLFDQTGITGFNRIFAEFLQNNSLYVGDTADEQNNTLYSGLSYTDWQGNYSLVTFYNSGNIVAMGTNYNGYNYSYMFANTPTTLNFYFTSSENQNITRQCGTYYFRTWQINSCSVGGSSGGYGMFDRDDDKQTFVGIYTSDGVSGKFGVIDGTNSQSLKVKNIYGLDSVTFPLNVDSDNVKIYLTTNNNTINNNTYNDNRQTVINNDGDVYNYDYDDEDPPVNPGGGSGGGGDTNVNIDFPNFNFPNFPDIDFSLKGLTDKFPFCIPFDMVALLQLLNAEPQAPRIQGQIPFGSFYTWNLDLDFSRFDDFAVIMRGLEFVGFIFFLISATINIAKG